MLSKIKDKHKMTLKAFPGRLNKFKTVKIGFCIPFIVFNLNENGGYHD